MSNFKRIIKNTIVTYGRSIISAGFAIISSRWVLDALGISDFGIFSLISSIIVFITFLNSVMSNSASRHFAFELGKKENGRPNEWFNSALKVHTLLPIFLIGIGLPIGIILIKNVLKIDPSRSQIVLILFYISLIPAYFSMISVPYIAMYKAKQKFSELALFGISRSFLSFIAAYVLLYIEGDKLLIYTILSAIIQIIFFSTQMLYAKNKFKECKLNLTHWKSKNRFIELITFALWNLIGNFGHLLRTQGISILTNIYFGTSGNAALGISNQISTQTSNLTNALAATTSPEIVSSVGASNNKRAVSMAFKSTKLGIYLILLIAVPMLTEIENILTIWLTTIPKGTANLCKLMIIAFMIEKSTLTHISLLQAINKIAKVQVAIGLIFSSTIIVAILLIKMGYGLQSVGVAVIISMIISRLAIVIIVKHYLDITINYWLKNIVIRYALITFLALCLSLSIVKIIDQSITRLFLNLLISSIFSTFLSYCILINSAERKRVNSYISKIVKNENFVWVSSKRRI